MAHRCFFFILLLTLLPLRAVPVAAQTSGDLGVQSMLDAQPGPLATFSEDGRSAATIIESAALYYGVSPQIHLALLEATANLLSDSTPDPLTLRQPFSPTGPDGFAAQIDWATRELRAGLGPYDRPPTITFRDGTSLTLTLDQAPEGVAVQRFLAHGRSAAQWWAVVERFGQAFEHYFANQLTTLTPMPPPARNGEAGFLYQPWPAGTAVVHLAYFDHAYPNVDSGELGNGYVVNYLGQGHVQYDGHDGHDYYFPDAPVGTPILAAADGIAYARTHRGLGVVIVHPNGYETVYWHLSAFAPIFAGLIDRSQGVAVRAGELIGTSGRSGFVQGTPHLHFEVRYQGRQVDPYGWYGSGSTPCASYAGCLPTPWLWHATLVGSYDFTPPDARGVQVATPPLGSVSINPPADLLFAADLDGHALQQVGRGFPTFHGQLRFSPGVTAGQALLLDAAAVTYPLAGNLHVAAGTISLWANLPERYPTGPIPRHYLIAASANPDDAPDYRGTMALRRDRVGPGEEPAWVFWTSGEEVGSQHLLTVPDTLEPGWHHFAISWDAATGQKALYLDGRLVAAATGVSLPNDMGEVLQVGRFTYGGRSIGASLSQLRIYNRLLSDQEIANLAEKRALSDSGLDEIQDRTIRIDTNALAARGGIVAVQLGINGNFEAPQPYYDAYYWTLPEAAGMYELAVRYRDREGNTTTITRLLQLDRTTRVFLPLIK